MLCRPCTCRVLQGNAAVLEIPHCGCRVPHPTRVPRPTRPNTMSPSWMSWEMREHFHPSSCPDPPGGTKIPSLPAEHHLVPIRLYVCKEREILGVFTSLEACKGSSRSQKGFPECPALLGLVSARSEIGER